ncbi:MAG: EcsC family protein [Oscillospiraceae bacterium]|nr:EcsC family protein [Oscillospiraceae bacterium]
MANILEKIREELSFDSILAKAISTPGVKVDRESFLRKELRKYCREETIELAVQYNPARAGISKDVVYRASKSVIDYESAKVTALSLAASIPGGGNALAAVGAASVDIVSYFTFVLRVIQELAYLYGFDEIEINENHLDSETMNDLLIFMGTMFQVQGASSALGRLAGSMAERVSKNLGRRALTKGAVYPFVKKIAKVVGMRMTKQIYADALASGIPVAGSLVSGGLTYICFRPNCVRLRNHLMGFMLCDPAYYGMACV